MKTLSVIIAAICAAVTLSGCTVPKTKPSTSIPYVEDPYENVELETFVDVVTESDLNNFKITTETVIEYTSAKEPFKNGGEIWLYDLNTVKATGYGMDGSLRDMEMYYGGKAYVEKRTIYFKLYDNIGGKDLSENAVVEYLGVSTGREEYREIAVSEEYTKIDISGYSDGLYRILFSVGGSDTDMYFYKSLGSIFLCSVSKSAEEMKTYVMNRDRLFRAIKDAGITPENSSDVSVLRYPIDLPNEDPILYRNDEDKWAALSYELTQPEWSDERKLLAIHDWMTENITYDKYRWKELKETRTQATGDYTGTWSLYDTHTGVCFDYANVLTIMCREQGIPTIAVDGVFGLHVWNAVYINNKWREFDVTVDIDRYVYGEDVNDITGDTKYKYDGYFTAVINKTITNKNEEILINHSLVKQDIYY